MYKTIKNKVIQFKSNQSGVAAIEFVLIFPVLVGLLLGAVEIFGHYNAIRKVNKVTSSLADIVAQSTELSVEQLNALHPLVTSLMSPLPVNTMRYRIAVIRQDDPTDAPRLRWEHINGSKNGAGKIIVGGNEYKATKCGAFANTQGKTFPQNQDSIFLVVNYAYEGMFTNYIAGPTEYEGTMIAIPRSSSSVGLTGTTSCF